MQIHELNNFTGTLGSGAYLAIDDGNDTGKISSQGLLAATEARIDNIIAGPAPSAEEIVDARLGADGVTYPSLGDAIRDQFSNVKSDIIVGINKDFAWPAGDTLTYPFHLEKGRTYTITNNVANNFNLKGIDSNDTETLLAVIPYNATIKYTPTSDYVAITAYSASAGTLNIQAEARLADINGQLNAIKNGRYNYTIGKALTASGSITDNANTCITDRIPVVSGGVYTIYASSDSTSRYTCEYAADGTLVDYWNVTGNRTITTSNSTAYIIVTFKKDFSAYVISSQAEVYRARFLIGCSEIEEYVNDILIKDVEINGYGTWTNGYTNTPKLVVTTTSLNSGFIFVSKGDVIAIAPNGLDCEVGIWDGVIGNATNHRKLGWTTERIQYVFDNDGFFVAEFAKADDHSETIDVSDYNGSVVLYKYGYASALGEFVTEPIHIRVGSYNVGNFTGENLVAGSEACKLAYRKAIASIEANLYGVQQDVQYFGENENAYDAVYAMFRHYYTFAGASYNYKAFLSDYPLQDVQRINYTGDTYSHTYFGVGHLYLHGRKILVVTVHYDWNDRTKRLTQIAQVKAYADNYERAIIIGDNNPFGGQDTPESPLTPTHEDYLIWKNGGYSCGNDGYFGDFDTAIADSDKYHTVFACDNVIVTSKTIQIRNVGVVREDWMNDHAIFWADLAIY